jgi:hypothetical protein
VYFQRLATEIAVLMPSSPSTIIALRSTGRYILEQWWSQAKRHAFRAWPYLLNSAAGIFLVTKCIKTHRFAQCLSKGVAGSVSQIRIHGMTSMPQSNDDVDLPVNGTSWIPVQNDLQFELHEAGNAQFTIFIERDASQMFTLTDVSLRDAAQKLWKYVLCLKEC